MKKITIINLIIISLFSSFLYGFDWVSLNKNTPDCIEQTIIKNGKSLFIKMQLPGFYKKWSCEKKAYEIIIPKASQVSIPGKPKVPFFSYLIGFSVDNMPRVEIYYNSKRTYNIPIAINSKDDVDKTGYSGNFEYSYPTLHKNSCKNYQYTKTNKALQVHLQYLGKMHGINIAKVTICPFKVIKNSRELIAEDQFTIELRLPRGTWNTPKFSEKFADLQLKACATSNEKGNNNFRMEEEEEEIPEEYLIITPSRFVNTLAPLVELRSQEGLLVTIKTIDEIKRELGWTKLINADKLHDFLKIYYNKQPCLSYVLLVGDVEFIPVKYKDGDGTDFYYSLLDDLGDFLPDVYLGRLPVNNNNELSAIIEKIIAYERMQPSKNILLASYFQDAGLDGISDRNYVYINELFRNHLVKRQYNCKRVYTKTPGSDPKFYSDKTPIPKDITFDGTTRDVINSINTGVAIVNHRDHGDTKGWNNPSFKIDDIDQLWNKRYPILFSVDCSTAKFDIETEKEQNETEGTPVTSDNESFCEKLLCTRNKGMVGIIAPSRTTIRKLNNVFDKGLMGAIWPNMFKSFDSPASRLGQVLLKARIKVLQKFGSNGWVNDRVLGNFRRYHLLGDPALRIKQPQ